MRERGIFLALLAGMGAFTYHTATNSGTATQVKAVEEASRRAASAEADLGATFEKFDKRRAFVISLEPQEPILTVRDLPRVSASQEPLAFDWVIATAPDPERTNLKLDFDRAVEALQLGAAKAGYKYERYWFPWRSGPASAKADAYVVHTGTGELLTVDQPENHRSKLPGVLLFRRSEGHGRPLALFLVSESPVAGLAPEEFRAAVGLGRALAGLGGRKDDGHLRVIGPADSGSLDSLSTLINTDWNGFKEIYVRTSTLDHASHVRFHKTVADAAIDLENGRAREGKELHFDTAAVDTRPAVLAFIRYVRENWRDQEPIALLTEEGTAFGEGGTSFTREPGAVGWDDPLFYPAKREGESLSRRARSLKAEKRSESQEFGTVRAIPFPRNLSELRNASEKQEHIPGFADDSRRAEMPRTGLLLSLKEDTNASLELPIFSKEQTPLSQESVLFAIGNRLKTDSIHYAGILATDPLDTVFLARYLRSECPNIRLFTLDPDVLFEHGSDTADFSGIMGVSQYPLFALSQIWSGANREAYPFPTDVAEAYYNSTLEVLANLPGSPIHGRKPSELDRRDTINPFSHRQDVLWITVAGRSGFEPVAVLDNPKAKAAPVSLQQTRFQVEYWPGWGYLFSGILACCAGFCGLMLSTRSYRWRTLFLFSAQPDKLAQSGSGGRAGDPAVPHTFYLFALGACLTAVLSLWMVVPGVVVQTNTDTAGHHILEWECLLLFAAGFAGVLLLRATLASPFRVSSRETAEPGSPPPFRDIATVAVSGCLLAPMFFFFRNPVVEPSTPVARLWIFLCIGCVVAGSAAASCLLPIVNLVQWRARELDARTGPGARHRMWKVFVSDPYASGALVVAVTTAVFILFAAATVVQRQPEDFLASYRALDLTNGVSPLVPIALLFAGLVILILMQLRRIANYNDRRPEVPRVARDNYVPKLTETVRRVNIHIRDFTLHPAQALAIAITVLLGWCIWKGSAQTLETAKLEAVIMGSAVALALFTVLVWIRLMLIWSNFKELLQQLERHPIRQVFSLLPRGFIWSPVWQGGGKKRTHVAITRSVECMQALVTHPRTPTRLKEILKRRMEPGPHSLLGNIRKLLEKSADQIRMCPVEYKLLERQLANTASIAAGYLEESTWRRGDYELRMELAAKERTKEALHVPRPDYLNEEPATICGELVAFRFLAFINFVLWHIDNLVTYVSVGFLLLVLAMNSYAFRARTIIDWLLVILFAVLTAGIVTVFAQADRDAILSRITGTEEGKLDRHFFTHLLSYGGVPALVLLATHFPSIGRFFFSWVKPALEAVH